MAGRRPGRSLTQAERAQLSIEALGLSARGVPNTRIAKQLSVHRNTVKSLLDEASEALLLSDEDRKVLRALVFTSTNEVKRRAYEALDAEDNKGEKIVKPTSFNLVPLLHSILNADDRLVKLFRLTEPTEVNLNLSTVADWSKAYRNKLEQKGQAP